MFFQGVHRHYFIKKYTLIFFSIIAIIISVIYYLIAKFGFVLPMSLSSIVFYVALITILLSWPTYKTSEHFLLLDYKVTSLSSYNIEKIDTLRTLFLKHIFRNTSIRNYISLYIIIYVIMFLLKIEPHFYGYFHIFFYIFLSELILAYDYEWIGYLHSGVVIIKNYIKNKIYLLQLLFLIIISIHIILYLFFNIKWLGVSISIMSFHIGTLPYILCLLEIIGFKPRRPNNIGFHKKESRNKHKFLAIPMLIIPIIFYEYSYKTPNVISPILTTLGIIGFTMHSYWIKKLTQYYKKKRFEIFEKSESV